MSKPGATDPARPSGNVREVLGVDDRALGAFFVGFFFLTPVMLFRLACGTFSYLPSKLHHFNGQALTIIKVQ